VVVTPWSIAKLVLQTSLVVSLVVGSSCILVDLSTIVAKLGVVLQTLLVGSLAARML
jgi:hypothetical protein